MREDSTTAVPDVTLINGARSGDARAFGQLWDRHHTAALRYAIRLVGRSDAEDLVSEAFTSIFQALRNGVGPEEFFRPYLYTSLKNLSIRWSIRDSQLSMEDVDFEQLTDLASAEEVAIERSAEAVAFRSLPTRWQEILWYGEVEGLKPREIAPIMGMSANSVAALAYRAREGYRRAWLEAQLPSGIPEPHSSDEVLVGRLRLVLVPLLLGVPAHEFLRDTGPAHAASAAVVPPAVTATGGGMAAPLVGSLAAALSIGAASVLVAAGLTAGGGAATREPLPASQPAAIAGEAGLRVDTDTAATATPPARSPIAAVPGDPVERPVEPDPVPRNTPNSELPTVEPPSDSPAPPLPPATIPVVLSPVFGQAMPTAAFPVAGAGTGGSWVTIAVDGVVSGVERVGDDARWTHTITLPLEDGFHELTAVQHSHDRSSSVANTIPFVVDTQAPPAPVITTTIDRFATAPPALSGTAEPGATITVVADSVELVQTTANASGEWATGALVGLRPTDEHLRVTQTDSAGHSSEAHVSELHFVPQIDVAAPHTVPSGTLGGISATGWPGASVRTTVNGETVHFSGNDLQTIGSSGVFTAYYLVPSLSPGDYELGVAYVDPESDHVGSIEAFQFTVTP